MKHFTFTALLLFILLSSASAQKDTTFYVNPETAAKGFIKVSTRYRDAKGITHLVVRDEDGNAYAIFYKQGWYFRSPLGEETTAAAD